MMLIGTSLANAVGLAIKTNLFAIVPGNEVPNIVGHKGLKNNLEITTGQTDTFILLLLILVLPLLL